jgi:hypothetical protein
MIIFVLVALTGGLWLLQTISREDHAELFIGDSAIQSQTRFVDNNMKKVITGDGTMDITHLPPPTELQRATEDIDLFAQREKPKTDHWYSNTASSRIWEMEKKCRAIERPEDLPEDGIKQRLDCAWMFNQTGKSGATLCSIAGPVLSSSRKDFPVGQFEFMWSKTEAIKKERIKECAKTRKCDLMVPGKGCGFCPELGYSVPSNPDGTSVYSDARCIFTAVMNRERCFLPRDQGGAGMTRDTCEPDSQGNLSKACLTALAQQASCTDSGTILQALKDSTTTRLSSSHMTDAVDALRASNFTIPQQILDQGNIAVDTALDAYMNISRASQSAPSGRMRKAATNLCTGGPFQVCDYEDGGVENFKLECLQKLYNDVGCQGRGTDFPTNMNINQFYGRSWGSIKNGVNQLSDMMTNTQGRFTIEQQKDALRRCIGTQLRRRRVDYCNELGVSVKMYLDGNKFFGRKVLTNQFFMLRNDSTYWDSLDIFASQLSSGKNVTLRFETNFNPTAYATLNYNRVGNVADEVRWNNDVKATGRNGGFQQNPVHGLIVNKDQQGEQRLFVNITLSSEQVINKSATWYMVDDNNQGPSINICRLPIERKNPIINIAMNRGNVAEISNTVNIEVYNLTNGTRGGRACTLFNGSNGYIKIMNPIRTKAFRSYTAKVFMESYGYHPRIWQFYNGSGIGRHEWSWRTFRHEWRWRLENETWASSRDNVQMALGYYTGDLIPCFKQNENQGHSIYAGGSNIPLNRWVHITWIWNADYTGYDLLLDGNRVLSATGPEIADTFTEQNFIGKAFFDGTHSLVKGGMEWFRAFDYPLSADEIATDMDDDW